jgi:hypothetical protein
VRISWAMIPVTRVGALGAVLFGVSTSACGAGDSADPVHQQTRTADTLRSTVLFAGDALARPQSIGSVGEWILVGDNPQPHALHVLRASDGSYMGSWGSKGRGPGEFLHLWGIQEADSSRAWLYDPSQNRLTLVSIPALVGQGGSPLLHSVALRSDNLSMTAIWIADSLLVSSGMFSGGRLAKFDGSGNVRQFVGAMPPAKPGTPAIVTQHAYSGTLVRHPARPLVAIGTRHADRVEIYRLDGDLLRVGRGPAGFEPVYEGATLASGDELRFGYVDLYAAGERLYALYSGAKRADRPGRANFGGEVHVFDWSGELVRILPLDHLALALAVADDERTLYTVRHNPTPAVLRYALSPR